MTPARQPQHIITDEDFDFIWKNISSPLVVRDRINVIKSRPHTSAPAPDAPLPFTISDDDLGNFTRWILARDITKAKAEREHCHRMCNERIGNVRVSIMDNRKNMSQDCYESIMNNIDNVTYRIQSLRQPEPQQEGRR